MLVARQARRQKRSCDVLVAVNLEVSALSAGVVLVDRHVAEGLLTRSLEKLVCLVQSSRRLMQT